MVFVNSKIERFFKLANALIFFKTKSLEHNYIIIMTSKLISKNIPIGSNMHVIRSCDKVNEWEKPQCAI